MLKYFAILLLSLSFLVMPVTSRAADQVTLYLFWQEGCPHCAAEEEFLADLLQKEPYKDRVNIQRYEISQPGTRQVLQQFTKKLNFQPAGVPITIIGDKYWIGFGESAGTDVAIRQQLDQELNNLPATEPTTDKKPLLVNLPLLGQVDFQAWSLPALTVVVGLLDGFNPCAMWTLLFLITLLLGMASKTRMWLLGSAFIVTSAVVYFIFMAAWLNFILFIGLVFWVRLFIGLVALGGGLWSLKKFRENKDGGCEINEAGDRRRTLNKLKQAVYNQNFLLALVGIVALAFTVNLVELVCSAGLPAVYTQVLAMNNLPSWQYYGYLLGYIFFFMLDDLLVFFIAMTTLRLTGISTKYSRWSSLIGGILMIIIALLLIFKPQWLMFG